jgi:hypothetical protein
MYAPQNQARISPALSALFELQRLAATGQASMQTPNGGVTIAAKLMQQGQGSPGGQALEAPGPDQQGLMDIVRNAQASGPSVAALQQQQQMQRQQPPGPPQQPPVQGLARGGIATLTANNMRGFKQGGVLGFDGTEGQGSSVPDIGAENMFRMPDFAATSQQPAETIAALPPEIAASLAEARALRSTPVPKITSREELLKALDAKYAQPAQAERKRIEGLGGLQQEILDRQKALYEKEVAGRGREGLGTYLRGVAAGPGYGPAAAASFDAAVRARESARTKEMQENVEFQKGIATLQRSTDKDEYVDNLKRVADTVTDSQKAAELFEKDKNAQLLSLRGELGPQMQAWARQHAVQEQAAVKREGIESRERMAAEATQAKRDIAQARNVTALAVADKHRTASGVAKGTIMDRLITGAIPAVMEENPELEKDSAKLYNLAYQKVLAQQGAQRSDKLNLERQKAADKALESIRMTPEYSRADAAGKAAIEKRVRDQYMAAPAAPLTPPPAASAPSNKPSLSSIFGPKPK